MLQKPDEETFKETVSTASNAAEGSGKTRVEKPWCICIREANGDVEECSAVET